MMSRLFEGTSFDRPNFCHTCNRHKTDCTCSNVILPPKTRMSERPGGKHAGAGAYALTPENSSPPADQSAKIRIERRKGNREVTVITGLEHPANDLGKLLSELKSQLGCGGAVQGRTVELQGDQAARTSEILQARKIKNRIIK
jgi:translation initiation factor 1